MKQKSMFFYIFFLGILLMSIPWPSAAQKKQVDVIKINDAITPATAVFISKSIEQGSKNRVECLVIQLDTPGGLDLSMRDIIKDIMNADIPIVVYVAPSGARAASAGVFITLAADIAAMAPGTNIGAAHPMAVGTGKSGQRRCGLHPIHSRKERAERKMGRPGSAREPVDH